MQKYSLNENYFEVIDDEHKAYWLGFIMADGSLAKTAPGCSGKNRLQIVLSEVDIEILEKLRKDLQFTGPINIRKYKTGYETDSAGCYLHVNSRKMCKDLEVLGMGLKENRCMPKNIPPEYIKDFIRGYFDGDGCISVFEYDSKCKYNTYHRKCREFSITSPEQIMLEFKDIFEKECGVSQKVSLKKYKSTTKAVSLRYGGKADVIALYHYLYDDATIYLQRKYNNFQKVLLQ